MMVLWGAGLFLQVLGRRASACAAKLKWYACQFPGQPDKSPSHRLKFLDGGFFMPF